MIAIDTNILVYAHRGDAIHHKVMDKLLTKLVEGERLWAIPWPCLHEFLAVVTHPKIYRDQVTPLDLALRQIEAWVESPSVQVISECDDYWTMLKRVVVCGNISGPMVHDAKIAAICLEHRVEELWTNDRDFSRFPLLKVVNPLVRPDNF